MPEGRMIPRALTTTVAVVLGTFGTPTLAVMVAVPEAAPVTGTATVVALAGNVTVAGTVAAAVLLDDKFTVKPAAGAGADRFS